MLHECGYHPACMWRCQRVCACFPALESVVPPLWSPLCLRESQQLVKYYKSAERASNTWQEGRKTAWDHKNGQHFHSDTNMCFLCVLDMWSRVWGAENHLDLNQQLNKITANKKLFEAWVTNQNCFYIVNIIYDFLHKCWHIYCKQKARHDS